MYCTFLYVKVSFYGVLCRSNSWTSLAREFPCIDSSETCRLVCKTNTNIVSRYLKHLIWDSCYFFAIWSKWPISKISRFKEYMATLAIAFACISVIWSWEKKKHTDQQYYCAKSRKILTFYYSEDKFSVYTKVYVWAPSHKATSYNFTSLKWRHIRQK